MPYPNNTMIHESAYVDTGATIGANSKVWHFTHISSTAVIGCQVSIGQNVFVGEEVSVGDFCKIQNNVSLYKGITLEQGVFCGPSCVFTNVLTPRAQVNRKNEFEPTMVKQGSSIGANATILCGNTLGEYCLIAAGAVITKSVPAHALMAGIPARQIGWVSRSGEVLGDDLTCPKTGEVYIEYGTNQLKLFDAHQQNI